MSFPQEVHTLIYMKNRVTSVRGDLRFRIERIAENEGAALNGKLRPLMPPWPFLNTIRDRMVGRRARFS